MKTKIILAVSALFVLCGIAISQISQSGADRNVGVGFDQRITGFGASSLGWNNVVSGNHGVSVGYGNTISYTNSIAIGRNLTPSTYNQILIGDGGQSTYFYGPIYNYGGIQADLGSGGATLFKVDTGEQRVYIGVDGSSLCHLFTTNGAYAGAKGAFNVGTDGAVTSSSTISGNQLVSTNRFSVREGTNGSMGTATEPAQASAVTVANTNVTASTRIFITVQTMGSGVSDGYVHSRTAGTGFVITNSVATVSNMVFAYLLVEP